MHEFQTTAGSSMAVASAIEQGRESFRRQSWSAAFSQLSAIDSESPLDPEDLVLLAQAARLIGRQSEGTDFLARAHQGFLGRGESQWAARCAFWLGFTAMLGGESAKAGGWFSRASRLLEGLPHCVERGYLRLPEGYRSFHAGDAATARAMFEEAVAIGELFGDKDLLALGLQGQGRALIRQGEIVRGVALLDEAMVAVTAGEVSALNAGAVYCSVLDACGEIFDMQRAQEWTSALERWCAVAAGPRAVSRPLPDTSGGAAAITWRMAGGSRTSATGWRMVLAVRTQTGCRRCALPDGRDSSTAGPVR